MAYVKLAKTVTDHILGYQSLNTLRDNFDAQHTAWVAQHGEVEPQYDFENNPIYPAAWMGIGHHNTPNIPRDVVNVRAQYNGQFSVLFELSGSNFVQSYTRLSAGVYFFEVHSLNTFWGEITPKVGSSTNTVWCVPKTYYTASPTQGPGISVTTYLLVGTAWTPTDMDFTMAILGTSS